MEEIFDKMLLIAREINALLEDEKNSKKNSEKIIALFKQKQQYLDQAVELGKNSNKDIKIFSDISSSKLNEYKLLEEKNIDLIRNAKSMLADKLKKQAQQKSLLIYSKR